MKIKSHLIEYGSIYALAVFAIYVAVELMVTS